MIDYKSFTAEVHQNAADHGFWDEPVSLAQSLNLIHSEISEALEEVRNGSPDVWHREDGKPEGVPSEMADVVIRILDLFGANEVQFTCDFNAVLEQYTAVVSKGDKAAISRKMRRDFDGVDFQTFVADLHRMVSQSYAARELGVCRYMVYSNLADIIVAILCYYPGIEDIIMEKHRFNQNRPYKHGKKF